MDENVKISSFELLILLILFTTGTAILVIPSSMTALSNQDAWLSALIGLAGCAALGYFFVICSRVMRSETLIQYLERIYGKLIGKMIGAAYVFFSFIGTTTLLYYFGNFTTTQILTRTPIELLNLMLAILVMAVVRAGLEVLARTGELLIPWFMFLFIALSILLLPKLQLERISPLYEAGLADHLAAAYNFMAIAGFPLVVFLMFIPRNINRQDRVKWSFFLGTGIGSLIVGVIVLLCILVLGASATARQMFPGYVLAKTISLFDIIQRLESVMASMWILTIFFKTALYFYACVVGLAQLFEVKDYRFLVLPLGILAVVFSTVVYPNVSYMTNWDNTYWNSYALIMGFFIPAVTLLIDKIKNRKKQGRAANQAPNS